ncbi:hypothetical protein GOV07_04060 [Candidatus Woesearchaeota archaeon]|nr:hypothetical protein [Candidatus Woesearchaeota archaeon]
MTGHFTPRQRAPKTLPVQKPPKPSRNHHLKEATKAKFHKAEKTAEVLASKAASELSKAAHGAAEYARHVKEEHDKKVKKHEKDQHSKTHKSRKHKAEHDHEPKPHFTLDQLSQNQAPPDKQFILSDGTSIRNLHGFYRAVQAMDTATLHIYINKEKNDFQLWIADSLKLPHVAARVGLATSKKEVLRALEET